MNEGDISIPPAVPRNLGDGEKCAQKQSECVGSRAVLCGVDCLLTDRGWWAS